MSLKKHDFKPGDKVKLVDLMEDSVWFDVRGIKLGAIFTVESTSGDLIYTADGHEFYAKRFELVQPSSASSKASGGTKLDTKKVPMQLLSPIALAATAKVLAFGAAKPEYGPNNWRKGLEWDRLNGAILRHLSAFMVGEDLDPETGLPHIDHVACEVMFLQELYRTRKDLDNRHKFDEQAKQAFASILGQGKKE